MLRIVAVALIAWPAFVLLLPDPAIGQASRRAPAAPPQVTAPATPFAHTCALDNSAFDDRIAACTRYLAAAGESKRERSLATAYRGHAHRGKGDAVRALADYNEAVRLDPANPIALNIRGLEFLRRGDLDRAIADFSEAMRLDPKVSPLDVAEATGMPTLAPPPLTVDIKPLSRQRAETVAPPPTAAAPESARPSPPPVTAIPVLKPDRPGSVAPVLQPPETGDVAGRSAQTPGVPLPAHIPPLAAGRGAAASPVAAPPPATPTPAAASPAAAPGPPPPAAVASIPPPAEPAAHPRRALVIGNSSYLTLHYAPNPVSDAADMASALRQAGFVVTLGLDLRRADMVERIARFAAEARGAETALIYFSGYGVAHMGETWLVPIDARVKVEADLRGLVRLRDVTDAVAGAAQNRVAIIDASRDSEATKAFGRGLAGLADAPGTLVVSAAQPNEVAPDARGRNSAFTHALLKRMRQEPNAPIAALMNEVRDDVVQATHGAQRPDIRDGSAVGAKAGP
jgi:tetratricopeptide (TPR) repeat protein